MLNRSLLQYEKPFYLGTSECDVNGDWKLAALLEAVQNTANAHSDMLQIRLADQASELSWVLFKTDIQIERYPHVGETVRILTYTKGLKSIYCPRYCIITDEAGRELARTGSLLILIDKTTRKAVSPKTAGIEIPDAEDREPAVKILMTQEHVAGEKKLFHYSPQYSDIDFNGHVNNARYADWLCNALGLEMMKEYEIGASSITYRSEVRPDACLSSTLTLDRGGSRFQFTGCIEEKYAFDITGSLRRRNIRK